MTVSNSTDIQFDAGDVWHRWHPGDDKCHAYGVLKIGRGSMVANLYFDSPELLDKVIAELTALRAEMTAPVITDSDRDCDAVNPDGSGEHCHKSGAHKTHRDSNGDTWAGEALQVAS